MIDRDSPLWQYMSLQQRALASDGEFLLSDLNQHHDAEPTDYSYLVFPFAKLYEGFLKQLFLDLGYIDTTDYTGDNFRIGRALSPHFAGNRRDKNVYHGMAHQYGEELARALWEVWKEGRNLVFHYFPHNYRSLSRPQAEHIIHSIIAVMSEAVETTQVRKKKTI
jgi:hypothetical protein